MTKMSIVSSQAEERRRQAEDRLAQRHPPLTSLPSTEAETRQLIHALEVHQAELEIQIEELLKSQDVTERKQTEEKLRESEAHYQLIAENTADVVWTMDPATGQFTYVSPSVEKLRGYTPQEVMAQPVSEALSPESLTLVSETLAQNLPAFIAQGRGTLSFVNDVDQPHKDGSMVHTEVTTTYLFNAQGQVEIVGVSRDITQRKKMEAALRRSEALLTEAQHLGQIGHLEWSRPERTLTCSEELYRIWGLPTGAVVTQHTLGDLMLPADRERLRDQDRQIFARRGDIDYEFRIRRADGQERWLHEHGHITYAEDGTPARLLAVIQDITERKQAEDKLRESEQRFRSVLEQAYDGIHLVDEQGLVILQNRSMENLLGLTSPAVLNRPIWDLQVETLPEELRTPAARAEHEAMQRPVLATGQAPWLGQEIERDVVRPDGSRLTISGRITTIRTDKGYMLLNVVRDITARVQAEKERHQAEAKLRESEAKLRTLFDLVPVGISILDGQQVVMSNAALEHILQLSQPALATGQYGQRRYLCPDLAPMPAEAFPSARAAAEHALVSDVEIGIVKEDGAQIWTSVSAVPLPFSDWQTAVVTTDITERKQAEAALAKMQSILSEGQKIAHLGSFEYAADTQATLWSEEEYRIYGLDPAEPSPAYANLLAKSLPPDEAPRLHQAFAAALQSGSVYDLEHQIVRPDGKLRWVHDRAHPHFDHSGKLVRYVGTTQDITERKQTEVVIQAQKEQLEAQNEELAAQNEELIAQGLALAEAEASLQKINSELETRIEARTEELRAANAALMRADRLKDEFLANMSHELRTPLTAILGLAEVMEKGIYGGLGDRQRNAVQMIHHSGEHLLQLINDILDLSKVEAGKMELQLESVAVADICHMSLAFIQTAAQKKSLRCTFQYDEQVVTLRADARRVKQMLVNLLNNAVKFTPEGGQMGLEVRAHPIDRVLHFVVWDSGIGIPAEQQRQLFQPFVQLDGSRARQYEGTGLGLALVKSLAELHGGEIAVESAGTGQGSRFILTLPWSPSRLSDSTDTRPVPAAATNRVASLAKRLGRPPVILAVDDNPTTVSVLTSFLEAADCRVLTAQDGAEALERVAAEGPDLMLLDMQMPRMDGLAVLQELRALREGASLPVIALTALAMSGDRERCLAAGANDYLTKPMKLDELAEAVVRQLERQR